MKFLVVAVVAVAVWNADRLTTAPTVNPLVVAAALAGLVAGFAAGRRVGHRDTGRGLLGLWFNRRVMGRAS